jgi:predicted dehydrogenase
VFHTPFIDQNESSELRGVVERTKNLAHLDFPAIRSYRTVDEMMVDPDIELIVVNTPNDTHVDFAKQALRAGKHVLIEKPFAPTPEEAQELFDLGQQVGKKVLPFHNRRFDSDFMSLKHVLDKGFVGKPIELHLRFDRYTPHLSHKVFKETKSRAGNGVMYDLGSHLLDQTISLFGKPRSMTKIQSRHREKSTVDDYAALILTYDGGLNVFITASLLVANPQKSFVLHGTKGSFIKDRTDVQERQLLSGMKPLDPIYGVEEDGAEGLLTLREGDAREDIRVVADKGDYMQLYDEVYEAIRHDKPYFVTPEQILWQLDILSGKR